MKLIFILSLLCTACGYDAVAVSGQESGNICIVDVAQCIASTCPNGHTVQKVYKPTSVDSITLVRCK